MKFLAKQDLELIDSKNQVIKVPKGNEIPEEFRRLLLLKNRDFIADLEYKEGIPYLTPEEEVKYNIRFGILPEQKVFAGTVKENKYTLENLTERLNELGETKFKSWAEETFGKKEIDKKKTSKVIFNKILKLQEEAKR